MWPQNEIQKNAPLTAELNCRFQFLHVQVLRDIYMCHRTKFQRNQIIRSCVIVT